MLIPVQQMTRCTSRECLEFLRYQGRLAEFFRRRNAAQFAVNLAETQLGLQLEPDVVFDQTHAFQLGGLDFELHHAPGETYDHVAIWIPQLRAAFVGDNYYRSFPNLYTPRGTKPRWALDYVRSLDLVLSWKPEILVSGHSPPILGERKIRDAVSRYRDAIAYVHDATVRGMNAGKDVATLMREIQLPERLKQNEKYGSVAWSVRGIFEGYAGWFQGNPTELFPQPLSESYRKLLQLCGVAAVVTAAEEELAAEHAVTALQLADIVLSVEPEQRAAWKVRQEALQRLLARSTNAIESGWLLHGVRDARSHLRQLESRPDTVTRWTAQESSRSPTSPAK